MAKRQSKSIAPGPQPQPAAPKTHFLARFRSQIFAVILIVLSFSFYLVPLFSEQASIQWDAVDVHYSLQQYFSSQILHGKLPVWTPNTFSGMPLIADPEIGAWYPLNWPFFLTGITPRAIQGELALHAILACLGAWLLASDLLASADAALLAGIFYGLAGFFAEHSSHVGIFQGAALFPWLLWSFRRALTIGTWRYAPVAAAIGACILMAGHFQTALYCFFGLFLFALSFRRLKTIPVLCGVMATVVALSMVTWWPALELAAQSIRAQSDFHAQTNAPLTPGALLTLVYPNSYGVLHGPYHGPPDITQFYFYAGLLLPVLAIVGLLQKPVRTLALLLLVPSLWYAFGPAAGLYRLIALLPGFRSVRSPVHIWFVAALALALLGAAGAQKLAALFNKLWIMPVLAIVAFTDVYLFNMAGNPLAYSRKSFDAAYGNAAAQFDAATSPLLLNPLNRFWAPADNTLFGPLNHALAIGLETTYGYNPLQLQVYSDYMIAAQTNARLLNGLSVTHKLDLTTGQIVPNPDALPRATFPAQVLRTGSLATLDPAKATILQSDPGAFQQDPHAQLQIASYEPSVYRIRYTSATPAVMRLAVPFFPGWHALVDGTPAMVFVLDQALTGVLVPAGPHELIFRFSLTSLTTALVISASAWVLLFAAFGFIVLAGPAPSSLSAVPLQESPKP